jgi:HEPN domain-containing protein
MTILFAFPFLSALPSLRRLLFLPSSALGLANKNHFLYILRGENVSLDQRTVYWIEISEYDLETAQVMLENGRFLYVGFMCHQAIEKMLKAHITFTSQDHPPYIHQLLTLARTSGLAERMDDRMKDTLDILDPLNIEARYPSNKDEIFKSLD